MKHDHLAEGEGDGEREGERERAAAGASRRGFVGATASAVAAGAVSSGLGLGRARAAAPSGANELRIGLIGCGGRGSGAALQALQADDQARLVALGDVFEDPLEASLASMSKNERLASRIDVPRERRFVGFDAFEKVIAAGVDVVLLATPPHFRPMHMAAAIAAGKHVFAEKPVAVDAPGARAVLAACEEARRRNLSVVSGLAMRYDHQLREGIRRIHGGGIGEVEIIHANDYRGPIWVKPRKPGWTDMQYQMRNWYYFTWLSGDFNVEQHVHSLDLCAWLMKGEYPTRAHGSGGRAWRGADHGQIYDHHAVVYEYASGAKVFSTCRQFPGSHNDTSVHVVGTRGQARIADRKMTVTTGKRAWEPSAKRNDKFQTEHDELFAAIRAGKPINNGEYMTRSTVMAIMGRVATYTGRLVTWDEVWSSNETLGPSRYGFDAPVPATPIAVPGPRV